MNNDCKVNHGKKESRRARAEAWYRRDHVDVNSLKDQEVKELLHELQVHQIELEMQNEDLRQAQLEIEKAHDSYAELYDEAPVGYITSDPTGGVVMVNRTIASMLDTTKKELKERGMAPFCDDPDAFYLHCRKALQKKRAVSSEIFLKTNNNYGFWASIESKMVPAGPEDEEDGLIRSIIIDISEKKLLEEELRQAQKLESVGVLAGGIAHDFNNILAIVMGHVELAKMFVGPESKADEWLLAAVEALLRAKGLTKQLLIFAKGGDPIKIATSLETLITATVKFSLHGSAVKCNFDFPDDLWMGDVDPSQMSQVIQNITINAVQSMPDGGIIEITGENVPDGKKEDRSLTAKKYIKLVVSDQGCGIHEKNLDKVFDPYFSTKQGGSGLGLAICHSIIQKHEGRITVRSKSGTGTTFTLFVPMVARDDQYSPATEVASLSGATRPARILVMDDESKIRDMLKEMLESLGHDVLLARDGDEAIDIFSAQEKKGQAIDLSIMDLTVPGGMGGKEAVQKILQVNSDAKVVVASGYSQDPVLARYGEFGFRAAISKPFQLSKLETVIKDVLD